MLRKKKRRSGKFYYKNEKEVMESLGLRQTPGSGNGWIVKEDGQNENVIAQLKSTDANSISISRLDLEKLNYNASVAHKIPMFVVQFLQDGATYLVVKPEMLEELVKYIQTGIVEESKLIDIDLSGREKAKHNKKMIGSSSSAREKLYKEKEEKYKKKNYRSAR